MEDDMLRWSFAAAHEELRLKHAAYRSGWGSLRAETHANPHDRARTIVTLRAMSPQRARANAT
jgi:hypothetical protein